MTAVKTNTTSLRGFRELIKTKIPDTFYSIDAKSLTLWRFSIQITRDNSEIPILFNNIAKEEKEKLHPADDIPDIFNEENNSHHRPATITSPCTCPFSSLDAPPWLSFGWFSSQYAFVCVTYSRPIFTSLGDLHADIKRIMEKFFTAGSDITNFLDAFNSVWRIW
ncbi:hypothetical protein BGZ95_004234 [Linnemannia exigua]|uniref:Crinkler effector protein N-terminal domain-containing protein n=1 Tax=Linnemannia exigua TaxID=604196 RepID=A0AAD4H1U0_9FUNG|nr:hypothetical protein BGZ95_004234 [Linnemannia exigua]